MCPNNRYTTTTTITTTTTTTTTATITTTPSTTTHTCIKVSLVVPFVPGRLEPVEVHSQMEACSTGLLQWWGCSTRGTSATYMHIQYSIVYSTVYSSNTVIRTIS